MVKNTTGGNKHKKHKNKAPTRVEAKIVLAEDSQVYAAVVKMMGGKHVSVICSDGETRMCTIEGKHYKRMWIRPNDIILANIETIGLKKICYLVHKYSLNHIVTLRNLGLLNFLDKELQENIGNESVDEENENEEIEEEPSSNYFDVDKSSGPGTQIANLNSDDDSESSEEFYDKPNNYKENNSYQVDEDEMFSL